MSTTVLILVAWVFLSRFDSDYDTQTNENTAVVAMIIATILAVMWDLYTVIS